jgi:hypothetical protein
MNLYDQISSQINFDIGWIERATLFLYGWYMREFVKLLKENKILTAITVSRFFRGTFFISLVRVETYQLSKPVRFTFGEVIKILMVGMFFLGLLELL